VTDVLLSESDQTDLRYLFACEPVPGRPLPGRDVLERLARLVPCDAVGVVLAGPHGYVVDAVELPRGYSAALGGPRCASSPALGIRHRTRVPGAVVELRADGLTDSIWLGLRNGRDRVAGVWLDRRTGRFSGRDLTLLRLLSPQLQRLVRDPGTPRLPAALTVQERRILLLVAAGFSNPEIAERMSVATCTVRKHLEHAYRKLGVTNRLAAASALRDGGRPAADPRDRARRRDRIFA
jgi:DNA-binding CsgD family transcriptional regulator